MDENVIRERIQKQFDAKAEAYDAMSSNYHQILAKQLLQLVDLQTGQRCLDLGAGTGIVALPAAAAVAPSGRVVALDLSEAMLAQGKAKAEAQQLTGIMDFIAGDMEHLARHLPHEWLASFDAITCSAATPFLRHPVAALTSWRQWLTPGSGVLAFNAFVPPAIEELSVFRQLSEQHGFPLEPDPFDALGSVQLAQIAMQAAGYSRIAVQEERKQRLMPAASAEEHAEKIWKMAFHNNPFSQLSSVAAGADQDPQMQARLQAFHDAYMAAALEDLHSSGRFDPAQQCVVNNYTVLHVIGYAG